MWVVGFVLVCLAATGNVFSRDGEAARGDKEAVAAVQEALTHRLCEEQFWCSGLRTSRASESLPLRIWLEGNIFLAEVKGLLVFAGPDSLTYFSGCITKEGLAVPLFRVGWPKPPEDKEVKHFLGECYRLLSKNADYVGMFAPYRCGDPFAEPCAAKGQIIDGVLDLIRYELSLDPQNQQLLDAGRIVVTIGEFSCFSESVWVLVEPTEAPVWEIKLLRGDTCEDMSIIPKGFTLLGGWPVPLNPEEQAMDNPVTPDLVGRIRAHGTVVWLTPKPQENAGTAQAPPEAGKEQKTEDKNTGSCLCCPSPAKPPGSSQRP